MQAGKVHRRLSESIITFGHSHVCAFVTSHGGAFGESLDRDSEVFQALSARGVDAGTIANVTSNVPLYWGSQPFTGGPIYFGITAPVGPTP